MWCEKDNQKDQYDDKTLMIGWNDSSLKVWKRSKYDPLLAQVWIQMLLVFLVLRFGTLKEKPKVQYDEMHWLVEMVHVLLVKVWSKCEHHCLINSSVNSDIIGPKW